MFAGMAVADGPGVEFSLAECNGLVVEMEIAGFGLVSGGFLPAFEIRGIQRVPVRVSVSWKRLAKAHPAAPLGKSQPLSANSQPLSAPDPSLSATFPFLSIDSSFLSVASAFHSRLNFIHLHRISGNVTPL
jgi:hypothetical protein